MTTSSMHFTGMGDWDRQRALDVMLEADRLRSMRGSLERPLPMLGRTAALIFHKPSLRTRVSFTVGMHELGGQVVELSSDEVSDGGRESLADVAGVLSTMCHLIVIRTFAHRVVMKLAEHATVPVINALTDHLHPCQVFADLYTLWRRGIDLDRMTVAWIGDGNNVLHSWLEAAAVFGFNLHLAVPDGFEPDGGTFLHAEQRRSGLANAGRLERFRDPREAVKGADVVYTDTWTSMGQEKEAAWRRVAFAGFQVDGRMMAAARPDAVFMHCLPAHRGAEVTDDVLDGPQCIVLEQAENRLHLQKALMVELVQKANEARRERAGEVLSAASS